MADATPVWWASWRPDPEAGLPTFAIRARDEARWRPSAVADSGSSPLTDAADAGWGVLHRDDIFALDVAESTLDRWAAERWLIKVHPRVFSPGHAQLRVEGWLYAALRATGEDAVLSHETAAWWLGVRDDDPARVHVSTSRNLRSTHWIFRHRLRNLHPDDVVIHRGLPTTTVARTLLDMATDGHRDERDLRRMLREAAYRRMFEREDVIAVLGRTRGHVGASRLRAAIERHHPELAYTRSELEARFVDLMHRERVTGWKLNKTVEIGNHPFIVDVLWSHARLVVELDGWQAHGTRDAFERDRRRDRALTLAGYRVLRFTWREVVHEGHVVAAGIRRGLGQRLD